MVLLPLGLEREPDPHAPDAGGKNLSKLASKAILRDTVVAHFPIHARSSFDHRIGLHQARRRRRERKGPVVNHAQPGADRGAARLAHDGH